MHFNSVVTASALVATAVAAPFQFPLANGFPNLNASALANVQRQAGGTLPNTPLPTKLSAEAMTAFQVIATVETFEVAYFTSLLRNITNNVAGYNKLENRTQAIAIFKQVRAQEELHAAGANAILKNAGYSEVQPCEYVFPVDNYYDAVQLAGTFTSVVLGALQGVAEQLGIDGGDEIGLIPLIGSIIGMEGEQTGAYRLLGDLVPNASPFLTTAAGPFAYNAIVQDFIVSGSCPSAKDIDVPVFKNLMPTSSPGPQNTTVSYSTTEMSVSASSNYITYISGQNYPVAVPITDVMKKGSTTTFKASFPFGAGFSKGLTIAALTNSKGPFMNATAVADHTVAGPGLVLVD